MKHLKLIIILSILLIYVFSIFSTYFFSKKVVNIPFPIAYMQIFNDEYKDSIIHINSTIVEDSIAYPISDLTVKGIGEVIMLKFDSRKEINELLKVYDKKTEITKNYVYSGFESRNIDFSFSRNIPRAIESIEFVTDSEIDTLLIEKDFYSIKLKLTDLGINFSKTDKINDIFIENMFLKKHSELFVSLLKENNSVYLLFVEQSMENDEAILVKQFLR